MIPLGSEYMQRFVAALERLSDAAMIAARAYEFSVKEDFGYEPGVEEDED